MPTPSITAAGLPNLPLFAATAHRIAVYRFERANERLLRKLIRLLGAGRPQSLGWTSEFTREENALLERLVQRVRREEHRAEGWRALHHRFRQMRNNLDSWMDRKSPTNPEHINELIDEFDRIVTRLEEMDSVANEVERDTSRHGRWPLFNLFARELADAAIIALSIANIAAHHWTDARMTVWHEAYQRLVALPEEMNREEEEESDDRSLGSLGSGARTISNRTANRYDIV